MTKEIQKSSKNILNRTRDALPAALATVALLGSGAQAEKTHASHKEVTSSAELAPKVQAQRTATGLGAEIIDQFRASKTDKNPTVISVITKNDDGSRSIYIKQPATSLIVDNAYYESVIDVGRTSGKLNPAKVTRISTSIQLNHDTSSLTAPVSLYSFTMSKDKQRHWRTLVSYTGQKGDDFVVAQDTKYDFNSTKFNALSQQAFEVVDQQANASDIGTIFPPNEVAIEYTPGPNDFNLDDAPRS